MVLSPQGGTTVCIINTVLDMQETVQYVWIFTGEYEGGGKQLQVESELWCFIVKVCVCLGLFAATCV